MFPPTLSHVTLLRLDHMTVDTNNATIDILQIRSDQSMQNALSHIRWRDLRLRCFLFLSQRPQEIKMDLLPRNALSIMNNDYASNLARVAPVDVVWNLVKRPEKEMELCHRIKELMVARIKFSTAILQKYLGTDERVSLARNCFNGARVL